MSIFDIRFARGTRAWAGSIKGDVKRKHFCLRWKEDSSLTSSPCGRAEWRRSAVVFAVFISTLRHHWVSELHKPSGGEVPTMVLSETRAEARHYGFVGLSEGAYGGP